MTYECEVEGCRETAGFGIVVCEHIADHTLVLCEDHADFVIEVTEYIWTEFAGLIV